ncbi:hypothetical protein TSUD_141340 [Trifolium subterraneum]|uniref:Reverse transcriptase zinc-binding domain-containing protein n=1 Tax=Trifolium subterraneum TaxID=3900 RepID=A0A2Z6N6D8_TRISU|nr:hypothetical protein TSUD_141340 [Trifolium subterraneum]
MLVDREGLWFRVLAARYRLERGRLCVGGTSGSQWWRELQRIRDGGGELGGEWFGELITKKVGDRSDTFFWSDPWLAGIPLCERFGRLFDLAENKSTSVDHSSDRRQWQPDLDRGYIIRGAYQLLTDQDVTPLEGAAGLIWNSQVPLKVSILVLRLLRDRLPTKANLITRGILSSAAHLCVSSCGADESTLVPLAEHFRLPLVSSQFLDWFFFGDSAESSRSLRSVY